MTSKQVREVIDNIVKQQAGMEFPLQIIRQYAASLDSNEIWFDLEALKEFAKTGATKYIGESVVYVDEDKKTITAYRIGFGGALIQDGSAIHTHEPKDIIETDEKQFISKAEKESFADKYTKQETDDKFKAAISGLAFKGTFNTLADLPSAEEAKDGWFAIVVNEPTAEGKNVLVIYESTTQEWKQLGDLLVPGVATEELDGLMGKDMVKALKQAGIDIAGLKDGFLLPKASATQIGAVKIGSNIQVAEDGTISTHAPYEHPETHAATMIVEDESHRFVSDADKAVYADKYTKTEADAKHKELSDTITAMDTAYKAADTKLTEDLASAKSELEGKITSLTETHNTDKTALEEKIAGVDAKFVAASDEQIDSLFNVIEQQ